MGNILVACIRLYQKCLSPYLGDNCRFTPSCSQYAIDAIRVHGGIVGSAYALWRLLRCQPLCKGGHDPVPEPRRKPSVGPHPSRM